MTTQTVRVDNLDIEYTDSGTGSTILFVHGVYVTGAVWNDVVAELGEGCRCIAPTWPLGAHSTPPAAPTWALRRQRGASSTSWKPSI